MSRRFRYVMVDGHELGLRAIPTVTAPSATQPGLVPGADVQARSAGHLAVPAPAPAPGKGGRVPREVRGRWAPGLSSPALTTRL
jgi:hypothetical protein